MRRREFMTLIAATAIASPALAAGRDFSISHIGLLSTGPAMTDQSYNGRAFIQGLAAHGYQLGKNLAFECRGADGHNEALPRLAAELAAARVKLIVTGGFPAAKAAKQATALPVVAINTGDPVATGLVASLARPGGNITGISDVSAEITPKRMELLKEIAPGLRRIAILWNKSDLGMTLRFRAAEAGARALGLAVQSLGVAEPDDFDDAFTAMAREMPDAVLMVTDALTVLNRQRVFEFAMRHRLPGIYEADFFVRDGGLMSYGPDQQESYNRLAALVDRILRGARPSELPFERPTLFRLAINMSTAKAIGLEVPQGLLALADDVVE